MMRACSKLFVRQGFSTPKFKMPTSDYDLANVTGLLQANQAPSLTFFEKLSYIRPGNMYNNLDQLSRDLLFTCADDYSLGLPASVILISLFVKAVFFYPTLKSQVMALKMKEIQPIMNQFQQKMKIAQMSRNMAMVQEAKKQFAVAKRKRGIDNFYAVYNLLQLPVLITWFLSLRYVATLPEVFPMVKDGFLWMDDLSAFDPYFILPFASACLTSYSIVISPAANRQVAIPMFASFMKYMKFLPFISLPFTAFFPALINIYWATLASSQLGLMLVLNSQYYKKQLGVIKDPSTVSHISKAMYIEQPSLNNNQKIQIPENLKSQTITISTKRIKKKKE